VRGSPAFLCPDGTVTAMPRRNLVQFGSTARYARTLRNRAVANMFLVAFVSFPVAAWWVENPLSPYRAAVTLTAASVLLATVYDLSGAYRRALSGIVSEQRVLAAVRDSSAAVVVNGARPSDRAGDIDHVVLGPMAVVIETKTGSGTVTVLGDQLRCNTRPLKGASLRQVRSQANAVSQTLGAPVAAVVCVVDMVGDLLRVGGVTVCSVEALPDVLDSFDPVLDSSQARAFGAELARG
jgi:hypothetical protein